MKQTVCDLCGKVIAADAYQLTLPMRHLTWAIDNFGNRVMSFEDMEARTVDVCYECSRKLCNYTQSISTISELSNNIEEGKII